MPELPEVETVCRQLRSDISSEDPVLQLELHRPDLRWPIPKKIVKEVSGKGIQTITRRGKYILFHFPNGRMLSHLGMSGSWRWKSDERDRRKHDHVELSFASGKKLVFHDPRRFGVLDWLPSGSEHDLLKDLGPEPLSAAFNGLYVWEQTRKRKGPLKNWLMASQNVVGIGNIYASEILYRARLSPFRMTCRIKRQEADTLVQIAKDVLLAAIDSGGSTIKDYMSATGESGGFQNQHQVYGREDQPCRRCRKPIRQKVLVGRSTYWCKFCQI